MFTLIYFEIIFRRDTVFAFDVIQRSCLLPMEVLDATRTIFFERSREVPFLFF